MWSQIEFVFFFQAEDGIRYLVRSRGLGDVYKRQNYYLEKIRDSSLYYLEICIGLAKKNKKTLNEADAIGLKAYLLYHLNKFGEAYKYITEAFTIAQDPASESNPWLLDKELTPHTLRLSILAQSVSYTHLTLPTSDLV